MKYPNAAKGVKRIFTAEILKLIGTISGIVGITIVVIGLITAEATGESKAGITAFVLTLGAGAIPLLAWAVLLLIAFIMRLVGIINARHDEDSFKSSLVCLILDLVSAAVSGVFLSLNNTLVASLLYSFSQLMGLFVTLFIISGIIKLADKLNRGDVSAKGSNVLKLICVIVGLSLLLNIVSSILIGNPVIMYVALILFAAAMVLCIVQYIMFLSFLAKAKKMLAES